jgi:hypothetical protein
MMSKGPLERRERLSRICKHIIADPSSVDGDVVADFKSTALRYANTQYGCPEQVLKQIYCDEGELGDLMRGAVDVVSKLRADQNFRSVATGALYPRSARSFNDIMDDLDEDANDDDNDDADRDDDTFEKIFNGDGDDDGGGGGASASAHHASVAADLLVEAGSFPHRAAALQHLLHKPSGQALLSRMSKAATHKKDHLPMDTLHSIMKAGSISGVCAAIVSKGSTTISEHELVAAVGKVAQERWPELTESQAFSKVYSDQAAEGRVLRQAIAVAKASLAETMLGPGLPVMVVGGSAAQDVNSATDAEAARAELMRIGRKQYPRSSENEVFERAFSDPRNATIVARLYQRPTPTSIYPMPNEWLRGDGSQHAKSDRGSAYNDLMQKAEEYRDAHPELSIAQAFEKVFTAPANRELAKRERRENAVR